MNAARSHRAHMDINSYAYVGGNPVSNTDPLGLWSVTFEGYNGVGGGITIGRDPNTGQPFMNMRAGRLD
jgi:hypothetical protein